MGGRGHLAGAAPGDGAPRLWWNLWNGVRPTPASVSFREPLGREASRRGMDRGRSLFRIQMRCRSLGRILLFGSVLDPGYPLFGVRPKRRSSTSFPVGHSFILLLPGRIGDGVNRSALFHVRNQHHYAQTQSNPPGFSGVRPWCSPTRSTVDSIL